MRFGIALTHLVSLVVTVLSVIASFAWIFADRGWPDPVAYGAALLIGGLFGLVVSNLLLSLVLTVAHKSADDHLKGYLHGE